MQNPRLFQSAEEAIAPLEKQLADAEGALVVAKSVAKPDEPVTADFLQATAGQEIEKEWVEQGANGHPEYVVVLQPISGEAPTPPTAPAGE